jgi:mannose-1-phosphate guanylyltransferase/mannose-6-phosphate isomerase
MLLLPADHYIGNLSAFHAALARAVPEAQGDRIVTFGISPTRAETGYGYIQHGAGSVHAPGLFEVARFVEKPDQKTAAAYLASGRFSWNAGLFLAKPALILSELQRHAQALLDACKAAMAQSRKDGQALTLGPAFERAPAIAFDRAVMEKTARASVVPVAMDWCDIGSWESVWELSPKDADNNARDGVTFIDDCRNSLVRAESRLVAVVGVDDLVVIETKDAVLVVPRAKAQRLADLVPALQAKLARSDGDV